MDGPPLGPLNAVAWTAIAKATRDSNDINRARQAIEAALPEFVVDGSPQVRPLYSDILSLHLALIHALADFNQIESDAEYHRKALLLLDYVYSDAYFDGRYIMHDRVRGRSKIFCSGCNFMAPYLADRLYGDTLVINSVAEPTIRDPVSSSKINPRENAP